MSADLELVEIIEILAFAPRNCRIRARETPGQRGSAGTMLATDGGRGGTAPIARDWRHFDELLARFDQGLGPEPEGPIAEDDDIVMRFVRGDLSTAWLAGTSLICSSSRFVNVAGSEVDPDIGPDDDVDEEPPRRRRRARPRTARRPTVVEVVVKLLRAGTFPEMQPEIDALLDRLEAGRAATGGLSERTLRRRALERAELAAALARDGRRTAATVAEEVAGRRSRLGLRLVDCEWCGTRFEAKRSDARFCDDHRKPRSRKGTKPARKYSKRPNSVCPDQGRRGDDGTMLATEVRQPVAIVDVDTRGLT